MRTTTSLTLQLLSLFLFAAFLPGSLLLAQDTPVSPSATKSAGSGTEERTVMKGNKVHELLQGAPIAAFSKGGEKEQALHDFIKEQKVAGLLILQDGRIRLERYAMGDSKTTRWSSLSVAKSVTSTLVGVAIKDGYIRSVDDLVTNYIPALKGSAYDSVTVRHLLTMTAGVRWNEDYDDPRSDIARFATDSVEPGISATVSYMRRLPAEAAPGKKFLYSTGETHLLGVLVSEATHQHLADYLSSKIWKPWGMGQNAGWRLDRTGQELAGCCLQMTLRDFARFGEFVLNEGRINGKTIVPEGWFKEASAIQVPLWPGGGYGFGWWIFNNYSFDALGIHGQRIHIDPSRHLVIAVNSAWPEADSNERMSAFSKFLTIVNVEVDKTKKSRLEQ